MNRIVDTPTPPYYAVIAPAEHAEHLDGYAAMAARMVEIARDQPGFLGLEASIS